MDRREPVAIDGPSGAGKSTAARALARRLGVAVLDTGAMYRALALGVLRAGVDPADRDAVVACITTLEVDVRAVSAEVLEVHLGGAPVGAAIRTPEVTDASSKISAYPAVRSRMVELQRRYGTRHSAVVEGRDIGTVVFPDTPFKFFLEADPAVRAQRRHLEMAARGLDIDEGRVAHDLARRDARDRGRLDSPLRADDSYHLIDTSKLTPEEVVEEMVRVVTAGRDAES